MNICVCIKQVPDSNKVEVDPVNGTIKRDSAESKMNPYDLYALEAAFRLKEKNGGKVTVIAMGPPKAEEIIREAYSMGADSGVLVTDRRFAGADVLATAKTLSQGIACTGEFDVIICGKQTTDGDTAQVGAEISEYMGIPCIAGVSEIIESGDSSLTVKMDMGDSFEIAKISFPCLICVDKDIFQPRLPSYVAKKATKDKEIKIINLDNFSDKDESHYGLAGSPTQVRRIFPPENSVEREIWHGSTENLCNKLYSKLCELKFINE
ncbi:MAG: electron transfer flavoprotein subunit beta/FixA family protein [Acutalibacteraceae bacterium]|jgi:electron transfer flavoprotein beta subunit